MKTKRQRCLGEEIFSKFTNLKYRPLDIYFYLYRNNSRRSLDLHLIYSLGLHLELFAQ